MNSKQIVSALDREIARLQRARNLLVEDESAHVQTDGVQPRRRGRRSGMSAAGRKRLSEAMKARWANRKKAEKKSASA